MRHWNIVIKNTDCPYRTKDDYCKYVSYNRIVLNNGYALPSHPKCSWEHCPLMGGCDNIERFYEEYGDPRIIEK